MPGSILQAAEYWLGLGCALLPCQPKSKRLVAGFGPYRKHVTTAADAARWFGERACNLAVCLSVGGLAVADFDDVGAFDAWRAGVGAGIETRIESTRRGAHVYFRSLVTLPALVAGGGVEVKGRGAVLVAPSVHPSGLAYAVICNHDPAWIDDPAAALPLLSKVTPLRAARQSANGRRPPKGASLVERIKAAVTVERIASGLTRLRRSQDGRWLSGRCPFHHDKAPSFWIDTERNLWGCRAASCPTNKGGQAAHDVINLAAWRWEVDERQAVRLLAEYLPRGNRGA